MPGLADIDMINAAIQYLDCKIQIPTKRQQKGAEMYDCLLLPNGYLKCRPNLVIMIIFTVTIVTTLLLT